MLLRLLQSLKAPNAAQMPCLRTPVSQSLCQLGTGATESSPHGPHPRVRPTGFGTHTSTSLLSFKTHTYQFIEFPNVMAHLFTAAARA